MSTALAPRSAARLCAALALAVAAGFCAAQATPATGGATGEPRSEITAPAPPPAAEATPPAEGKNEPAAPREPRAVPTRREADIALVLPLESANYQRAAAAVRNGFMAAAEAAKLADRCRVIGHGDGGVLAAFDSAQALGVRVVVGPLVRDDLRTLATSTAALPLTLALNQLDDGVAPPPGVYTLALAVESDARVIARRMRNDGISNVAVISSEAPLPRRFALAFAAEWLLAGGGAPQAYAFGSGSDALGSLRRDLAKSGAEATLVALDGGHAALARTFAPRLPAYASSLVNQPLESAALRDLEGVVFVDLPWLVTPSASALAGLPRREQGNPVLDRLYALGLDAFRVARAFLDGVPEKLEFAGATGQVSLGEGRQLAREGTLATFRRGQVVPAEAGR